MSTVLKAILAFAGLLATNVAANLMNGGMPWPQNGGEWARFLVSTLGTTLIVWAAPNTTKNPQVARTQSVRLDSAVATPVVTTDNPQYPLG
jgi:hypothetical protein